MIMHMIMIASLSSGKQVPVRVSRMLALMIMIMNARYSAKAYLNP